MRYGKLKEVTGAFVRQCVDDLVEVQDGCCSLFYERDEYYDYAVCIGWHNTGPDRVPNGDGTFSDVPGDDGYRIAWKIGLQSHNNVMQSDFDIDFFIPYNKDTGDLDGDPEVIEVRDGKPVGYGSWAKLATAIRKEARRVWKEWKGTCF